jgi:hypothetical protein
VHADYLKVFFELDLKLSTLESKGHRNINPEEITEVMEFIDGHQAETLGIARTG